MSAEALDAAVRTIRRGGLRNAQRRGEVLRSFQRSRLSAALLLGLSVAACSAGSSGITHVVRPGENLYRIGQAYGVSYQELAKLNEIGPPYRLEVGDRLHVPGASKQLPVNLITPRAVSSAPPPESERRAESGPLLRPDKHTPSVKRTASIKPAPIVAVRPDGRLGLAGFAWPVSGELSSGFGRRARGHHDGIDIVAPKGSPVYAARDGTVIFADRLSGYGNVLIVEHADGYTTVYAHNEANLAVKGARVRRGQAIARVGDTGRASASHLHFEVRKQNVARNPLYYLPGGSTASVAAAQ